jgi:hypothetical protein
MALQEQGFSAVRWIFAAAEAVAISSRIPGSPGGTLARLRPAQGSAACSLIEVVLSKYLRRLRALADKLSHEFPWGEDGFLDKNSDRPRG